VYHSDSAALIITYRRFSHLEKLVDLCLQAGISRIYISSDGSKSHLDRDAVIAVRQELSRICDLHAGKIIVNLRTQNLGAAVNVLSACDWVFSKENFAVVLEDDCIPSKDFFSFVSDYKDTLLIDKDLYLICGTQFAPTNITNNLTSKSIYPMVWGWATSRDRWVTLTTHMLSKNFSRFRFFKLTNNDKTFWRAGARRAFEGYVDAWDIPMVKAIRDLNGKVLVPGSNLISNVGGDEHATHTFSGSKWLYGKIEPYFSNDEKVYENEGLDDWIKKSIYGIRMRHQLSTRATFLIDRLSVNRTKKKPLLERWNLSKDFLL
jgi:hypothetical protein